MSPGKEIQYPEIITSLKERISKLEEEGVDVQKVTTIIENLDETLKTEDDDKKKKNAISKFEKLLSKMESDNLEKSKGESKVKTTRRKRKPKKDAETKKGKGKDKDPQEIEGSKGEDATPDAESHDDATDIKGDHGGTNDQEEGPQKEKAEDLPIEGEDAKVSDESEEKGTSELEDEKTPPSFDVSKAEEGRALVASFIKDLQELGGDIAPIQPHIDAMENAIVEKNIENHDTYFNTVRNWMIQYLVNLRRGKADPMVSAIGSMIHDLEGLGAVESISEIKNGFDGISSDYPNADHEGLKEILEKLAIYQNGLKDILSSMTDEITQLVNKEIEEISLIIEDIHPDVDVSTLRNELQVIKEQLFNGELMDAKDTSSKLIELARKERINRETKRLDSMLLSIEPLLSKVEGVEGPDSKSYKGLITEKERVIETSKDDIFSSLSMMGDLIDKVSIEVTRIDEILGSRIKDQVAKQRKLAIDLKDTLELGPVLNLLERTDDLLMDGLVDEASKMLNKANGVFDKLKEKKEKEITILRIKEIGKDLEDRKVKGVDVTPVQVPLESARKDLEIGDMEKARSQMAVVEGRLLLLRNEELKLSYQKSLIRIMNGFKDLRDEGKDISEMEKDLESCKDHFMGRRFEEALSAANDLLIRITKAKLEKVIEERKSLVLQTLFEAEGLLIDIAGPKENIDAAEKMIQEGEVDNALDLLCHSQVELEDLMLKRTFSIVENEIRSLEKECMEYSIDPQDVNGVISKAYSLSEESDVRKAMEYLTSFKDSLTKKVSRKKVRSQMEIFTKLIKQGRSLSIQISPFKAALTKANVLIDAGDIQTALDLVEGQVMQLQDLVTERRGLQEKLDRLRGNLLAQQGKISRLERNGLPVKDFKERAIKVKELIDQAEVEAAEDELTNMDIEVNKSLTGSPEQLKKEMMTTIMEGKKTRPLSIDKVRAGSEPTMVRPKDEGPIDQDRARSELFILIPKIKVEITRMHSKGLDTEEYKRDIETIQNLVVERKYVKAHELGKQCYAKMKM